jgi:post-segregation antitoxin (ccd killing protein)
MEETMANLTITVDDQVLKRARVRAIEQGTSVNALLAEHLQRFARARSQQDEALDHLDELADRNRREGGAERAKERGLRSWTREDLHAGRGPRGR